MEGMEESLENIETVDEGELLFSGTIDKIDEANISVTPTSQKRMKGNVQQQVAKVIENASNI